MQPSRRGFTLIELLVVVALVAIVLVIAAPSFRDYILMQRLKGTNAQVVTDMQFARSEAAARNQDVRIRLSSNSALTCYVLFTGARSACNCQNTPVCDIMKNGVEIRTVVARRDLGVLITPANGGFTEFWYNAATGGIGVQPDDSGDPPPLIFDIDAFIDPPRKLRTAISAPGRPSVCAPLGSTMNVEPCPP